MYTHNIHVLHVYSTSVTFELSEVVALLRRDSRSLRDSGDDMALNTSMARSVASRIESEMVVG